MRKIPSILCAGYVALFVAVIGLPSIGYGFELYNADAAAGVWTGVMAAAVVALCIARPRLNRFQTVCCGVLPFLTVAGIAVPLLHGAQLAWVFAVCCTILAVFVMMLFMRPMWVKITAGVLMLPVLTGMFALAFFGVLLHDFGVTEVVRTVPSPDGTKTAEIIVNDEGALGGSTVVDVRRGPDLNLGFARFCRLPQRVYLGDWGEFEEMTVEWVDADTLMIDGVEYGIEE